MPARLVNRCFVAVALIGDIQHFEVSCISFLRTEVVARSKVKGGKSSDTSRITRTLGVGFVRCTASQISIRRPQAVKERILRSHTVTRCKSRCAGIIGRDAC